MSPSLPRPTSATAGRQSAYCWTVVSDPQHRWLGPEKGVIALATAAISNAVWDMFAKARGKPLWKLVCDFTPEE